METAMALALARIELIKDINPDSIHWEMFKNDCMEKEKEQMIVFGKKMQLVQHVSYDDDITYCFEPEEYYNQTYNQNK
jgi:hypothetical protein